MKRKEYSQYVAQIDDLAVELRRVCDNSNLEFAQQLSAAILVVANYLAFGQSMTDQANPDEREFDAVLDPLRRSCQSSLAVLESAIFQRCRDHQ